MAEEYAFRLHVARRFVEIVFRGFWSIDTVESYICERGATVAALAARGCPFHTCTVLVDAQSLKAQPLGSIAAFAERVGQASDQPRRSALLVASALFRMQGERMAMPNQRVFEDRSAAMIWLGETGTAGT